MHVLLRMSRVIDRCTGGLGRLTGWVTLAMVLVGSYNSIVRYLGRYIGWQLSSNAYLELQWYLFSLVFLLGASYTLQQNRHVRVDVLYGRVAPRTRAWIDLIGTLVLLLPFSVFALYVSWPSVRNSWQVREISPDPGGLLRYPIKSAILVGFALLILQGLSIAIRQVAFLRGELPDDEIAEEMR